MRRKLRRRKPSKPRLRLEREDRTIVISSPMMDMCHTTFTASLVHLVAYSLSRIPNLSLTFQQYGTSMLPLSRQLLVMQALRAKASHILWIDSDMKFPPDLLERALRYDPKAIVAANCISRRPPYRCTAQAQGGQELVTLPGSQGLEKVERVGMGVMWTPTAVFQALDPPWFTYEWLPEKWVFRGEDYVFCNRAREKGFELFVDHTLSHQIEHIGAFGYTPAMRSSLIEREARSEGQEGDPHA